MKTLTSQQPTQKPAANLKPAAIYARFSTDNQKSTSVDDQVRNCLALAAAKGYTVSPENIYTDSGVSGGYKSLDKRHGYASLVKGWEAGLFSAVIADEVSRLARDDVELAILKRRVQQHRTHLLTVDGTDSAQPGWALLWGVKGVLATEALAEYAQRTRRGMLGAVLRGYQVGTAPFGYRAEKVLSGTEILGTKFTIHAEEAAHVRTAFQMRASGRSLNEIASHFNANAVPPRSKSRPGAGYWRPAQIRMLLSTELYAGFFTYPVTDEVTGTVSHKRFDRPELRLVSDDLFNACAVNTDAKFTAIRGGVSHYLAGLVTCGSCGNTLRLAHDPQRTGPGMRCAQCETRVLSGVAGATAPYVSSVGLDLAVRDAVSSALTPEVADVFRARLLERLTGGHEAELAQLKQAHDQAKNAASRLVRLLSSLSKDDPLLESEYRRVQAEADALARKIEATQAAASRTDPAVLKRQLAIDPAKLLTRVFKADPAALGARLRRFFSSITLDEKPDRATAIYTLCLVPGAIAAELTGTAQLDQTPACLRYKVKQKRVAGGKVTWQIERLAA